jgi:hypothetical protein
MAVLKPLGHLKKLEFLFFKPPPGAKQLQGSWNYMGQNNMGQKSGRRGKSSFSHQIMFRNDTLSKQNINIIVPGGWGKTELDFGRLLGVLLGDYWGPELHGWPGPSCNSRFPVTISAHTLLWRGHQQ